MFTLVVAGEAIFFLPFVIARVFRPTLLDVFGLTNVQLGMAFSAYGVAAMLSYFPGGPLADRFGSRKLMAIAMLSTSVGGLVMALIPSVTTLLWLYGFWGLTTILLFWAALIRATRCWGGDSLQGSAFGLLDGGRGLVAAVSGSIAVFLFASWLPSDLAEVTPAHRAAALRRVILAFTALTFATAWLVWFTLPRSEPGVRRETTKALAGVRQAARMPVVWLQALIVVCAYVAYKGLDDVSLYAKEAIGFSEVPAAYASTVSMWVRPPAAIIAGVLADRTCVTRMTGLSFVVLAAGSFILASGLLRPGMTFLFFIILISTSAGVFALRGLYFAIMREGRIPLAFTGSAVGIVSAVGYTPDIFMGPLMGFLLDRWPGALGHQRVFAVIAAFCMIGLIATALFRRVAERASPKRRGP